jgi:hypothetical protein
MISQTPNANPIAPQHASSAWGVVWILVLVVIVTAVAVLTWLVLDRIGNRAHR